MKSFLVTGAGSGIGAATVERLLSDGHRVFAATRGGGGGGGTGPGLRIDLALDVTEDSSLSAAVDLLAERAPAGLDGVVHSAGIPIGGALEEVEPEELRRIFEVNVIAPIRLTGMLMPQLRRARGRVVLLGSLGGRVAFPFAGPYHATKYALEAIADGLRLELKPQGVGVALIEPSAIATPIWAKARAQVGAQRERLEGEASELYDSRLADFQDRLSTAERKGDPVEKVAATIAEALEGTGSRYPVGRGAGTLSRLRPLLPDALFDRIASRALA